MGDWILVIDDDVQNLRMANHILSEANMRVSCLKSGEQALAFLKSNRPDIILLDIHMPGMDGFETIRAIRENPDSCDIPVIFLTADDDSDTEMRGLKEGAVDFIRKPFVAEVLLVRIRHMIELIRLQNDLTNQVEEKTQEVIAQHQKLEKIFEQLVWALSGAIDAKDSYTNGHSSRVAEYSLKIAKRLGWSEEKQNDIFMMAMLHDVGKIGVPDEIINKPGKLTDEELR